MDKSSKRFKFGSSSVESVGVAVIRIPCSSIEDSCSDQPMSFACEMDIVDIDVPLLVGLDVLRDSGATVEISAKVMRTRSWQSFIEFSHGHIFVQPKHGVVLFSATEVTSLHRKLAHPSASKLKGFLQRARPSEMDSTAVETINKISIDCDICTRFGQAHRPVRSAILSDNICFNIKVSLDVFYLDTRPVLHVICRGTRFSATSFLSVKSSAAVWNIFLAIWVYAYLGPPRELLVDQGTEVTSEFFRQSCDEMVIHLIFAPVESHSSLGLVERMHGPIRNIYKKLMLERPSNPDQRRVKPKELLLAAATKALNDTAGVQGLVPTLLVFGALPHVILDMKRSDESVATQLDRLRLMSVTRDATEKYTAMARLAEAQKHTVPSGDHTLTPGDQVLIFREKNGWTGPATLLDRVGGSAVVYLRGKRTMFPAARIKPLAVSRGSSDFDYDIPADEYEVNVDDDVAGADNSDFGAVGEDEVDSNSPNVDVVGSEVDEDVSCDAVTPEEATEEIALITEVVKSPNDGRFAEAIEKELAGLVNRDVFEAVHVSTVPGGSNIMGSKFHIVVKDAEMEKPVYKALLVIFGHMDAQKKEILSEAPTVSHMSIRTLLSLSVVNAWPVWSRDFRQAFLQSESTLSRTVYMRPPRQLQARFPGQLMRPNKPLYGIVEAPSYWYDTYIPYFIAPLRQCPRVSLMSACCTR
jgi:Reverse transcriptase (RNA-dependent DNA polymerase)